MADNKNLRGPQDANRVNVHEDYELQYWSDRFNVSPERLKDAVAQVGTSMTAIGEYLTDHQHDH